MPSAARLLDSRHIRKSGLNPEFDFDPQLVHDPPVAWLDYVALKAAIERDALRSQRHNFAMESVAQDVNASYTGPLVSPGHIWFNPIAGVSQNYREFKPFTFGVLTKVTVLSGPQNTSDCQLVRKSLGGTPALEEYFPPYFAYVSGVGPENDPSRGTDVWIGLQAPHSGDCPLEFRLVHPATLSGGETEGPAHAITITVP